MFLKKTLFVVGAGASREAGLPIGSELAAQIGDLLASEYQLGQTSIEASEFFDALRSYCDGDAFEAYLEAARKISDNIGAVNSIDNYIHKHQHDPYIAKCAKAAIVYTILKAERSSLLAPALDSKGRRRISYSNLSDTWFIPFGRMLTEGVTAYEVEDVFLNISIICFNYDRCIEHFLTNWLMDIYSIDSVRVRCLFSSLKIFRPYGIAGEYFDHPSIMRQTSFGQDNISHNVQMSSKAIRTYTEQGDDIELSSGIHDAVSSAETIVFLGFAFHPKT